MTDPIQHLRELMARVTGGEWKWATSCSFRRLIAYHENGDETGVAYAFRHNDGMCDIAISEADMAVIEALRNLAPELLEVAEAAQRIEAHTHTCAFMEDRSARCDCGVPDLWKSLAALGGKGGGG